MPDQAVSLRESIEDAIEAVEPEDSDLRAPEKPVEGEPVVKPAVPGADGAPASPAKPAAPATGEPGAPEVKPDAGAAKPAGTPQPGQEAAKPVELKAPSQWKPQVREKWGQLPREVQEEIIRREGDNLRLVGSVGQKIKFADDVGRHLAPFAERLQGNKVSPNDFVADVFNTVKGLAHGSQEEKAALVANIVQTYGVDLRVLDQVLTARISAPPPNQEVMAARQLAARAEAVLRSQRQGIETQVATSATSTLDAFGADPKNEFFADVRDLMADLMEAGRAKTLDEAYSAAVWAHPDTRKILLQREAQQRATTRTQRAAAAREASSSIHGTPLHAGGAALNPNATLRETIEAAIDEHSPL